MALWKNDEEMFALMKETLYTPVVGDILDQMGYKHQFLPAEIRPLAALAPVQAYIKEGGEDNRLKLAGFACTILENDVFEEPKKPFGYLTEALDQLKPNEKFEIIEKEYGIPLTEDLRKDVNVMCNLSQGIVDDTEMKIVINMYKNNFTLEQISLATKKSIAEIERIINENSIALPQK